LRSVALAFTAAVGVLLASCATVPRLSDESQISIEAVADRVRCELRAAAQEHEWLKGWVGAVTLTLEVQDKGGGAGSLGFVVPIHNGTFTMGFTGGPTETAKRTVTVEFPTKIAELKANKKLFCPHMVDPATRRLDGELGIVEWVRRVASTVRPPTMATGKAWAQGFTASRAKGGGGRRRDTDRSIGYTLEFGLLIDASITPGFKVVPAKGHERSGALKIFGSRDNSHKLDIALSPNEDDLKNFQIRQQFRSLRLVLPQ
jgi:hypothetical protein